MEAMSVREFMMRRFCWRIIQPSARYSESFSQKLCERNKSFERLHVRHEICAGRASGISFRKQTDNREARST